MVAFAAVGSGRQEDEQALAAALHEVSNGLTVVLGWLSEAAKEGSLEGASVALGIALARTRRLHALSRGAITGATAPRPAEPLSEVITEATTGLQIEARGRQVEFVVEPVAPEAWVDSAGSLIQVLTNLLLNALDVTPRGGRIWVRTTVTPGRAELSVEDSGPGIEESRRDRLFERGATTKKRGAGIGLAHSRELCLKEGGDLFVAPFEAGRGATFTTRWPLFEGALSQPETVRAVGLVGATLAIVEDDDEVADLFAMVLEARGAEVFYFRDAEKFEEALKTGTFEVALIDASPYEKRELGASLTALAEAYPAMKLILISGAIDPACVPPAGVPWLRKPFAIDELLELIRSVRAGSS